MKPIDFPNDGPPTFARLAAAQHPHDQALEVAYARSDAFRTALWHKLLTDMRLLLTLRLGSAHCDFNAMRYDKADRISTKVADELEAFLKTQDWYNP